MYCMYQGLQAFVSVDTTLHIRGCYKAQVDISMHNICILSHEANDVIKSHRLSWWSSHLLDSLIILSNPFFQDPKAPYQDTKPCLLPDTSYLPPPPPFPLIQALSWCCRSVYPLILAGGFMTIETTYLTEPGAQNLTKCITLGKANLYDRFQAWFCYFSTKLSCNLTLKLLRL